jgi:glucosamine kinase
MAGASSPETSDWIRRSLAQVVSGPILVVGDQVIAYEAALRGGPGIIVISGTGSIAYGQSRSGVTARAGGHGPATSDEGSARWIVRRAIQSAVDNDNMKLLDSITSTAGLPSKANLERTLKHESKMDLATLAPVVLAAAERGDPDATAAVTAAGEELAALVAVVARELWTDEDSVHACVVGGMLSNSLLLRESFEKSLRLCRPNVFLDDRQVDPIQGAIQLARLHRPEPSAPVTHTWTK